MKHTFPKSGEIENRSNSFRIKSYDKLNLIDKTSPKEDLNYRSKALTKTSLYMYETQTLHLSDQLLWTQYKPTKSLYRLLIYSFIITKQKLIRIRSNNKSIQLVRNAIHLENKTHYNSWDIIRYNLEK